MTKVKQTIMTSLRLPPDLHGRAVEAAFETHIPLNSFILQAISEKLKRGDHLDSLVDGERRSNDDGK